MGAIDIFNIVITSFGALTWICIFVFIFSKTDFERSSSNDRVFGFYLLIPLFLFAIYLLFRIFTERWLTLIQTKSNEIENKKLIAAYKKKYNYHLHTVSENYIVLIDENYEIENSLSTVRLYVFLLSGSNIYYSTLKRGPRAITPSLLHYWIIRKDIKKWVKKRDNNFPPHLPL